METQETTTKTRSAKAVTSMLKGYKFDPKLPQTHRIAHFLHWGRHSHPGIAFPYNIICKAINGYAHTPRTNNEEVEAVRRRVPSARTILQDKYKCDLISEPGYGARASVDSLDGTKHSMPGRVRRVNSAVRAFTRSAALIDVAKLPSEGPDKRWREWFKGVISPAVKALAQDETLSNLLPAPAGDNKKETK